MEKQLHYFGDKKMPCSKYKSEKQRRLSFATEGWKNWDNIKLNLGYQNGKRKKKRI